MHAHTHKSVNFLICRCVIILGAAEKRVIPGDGPNQFEFRSFMPVTLSCDHRVIDGMVPLAEYIARILLVLFRFGRFDTFFYGILL